MKIPVRSKKKDTTNCPQKEGEKFAKTEQFAKLRYEGYKRLSEGK